jgi:flagellar basal-body rod protein FlgF
MASTIQALTNALQADQRAMAIVSNNISNLSTPGFKKAYAASSVNATSKPTGAMGVDANNALTTSANDYSPGAQKITGSNLDLAINGAGFFVLAKADGTEVLTRDGQFSLNGDGNLVNAMGDKLMGESGELIFKNADFSVQDDGTALADGVTLGKIKIRQAADLQRIDTQANQFASEDLVAPQSVSIAQGRLEGSNVNSADEMVRIISISRHIESVQRALSIYDRTLDVGINRLGEN